MTAYRLFEYCIWYFLWYYLLDICTVNSYLIWRQNIQNKKKKNQYQFQDPLIKILFDISYFKAHISINNHFQGTTVSLVNQNTRIHCWGDFEKHRHCIWYKDYTEEWISKKTRPVLAEIVNNAVSAKQKRQSKTYSGCIACNVYLCRKGTCFEQYHSNSNVK